LAVNENDPALEIIAVTIGNKICGTYKGLSGTFASFVYCCLDKKVLPGFHDESIIVEAKRKDKRIVLNLSKAHLHNELMEIMDIAILNIGALPHTAGNAGFFIEVILNNKEG
jgi:hypothetical protein